MSFDGSPRSPLSEMRLPLRDEPYKSARLGLVWTGKGKLVRVQDSLQGKVVGRGIAEPLGTSEMENEWIQRNLKEFVLHTLHKLSLPELN